MSRERNDVAEARTQAEVGTLTGYTRARIAQIEREAIRKLWRVQVRGRKADKAKP